MRRILLILPAILVIGACTEDRDDAPREAPREPYLQFEYQVARAQAAAWEAINRQLIDGDITIEEAELNDGPWCEYTAQMEPRPNQVGGDLPTLEQTLAPYLSAFGHPRRYRIPFAFASCASNVSSSSLRFDRSVRARSMRSARARISARPFSASAYCA